MAPSLTIVVTCADRKSLPVSQALRFRDVPPGALAERVRDWSKRLHLAGERRPLRTLYQGEQWRESLRLADAARKVGFEPKIVVASAGLGLQPIEVAAPAYAATFSLGSPDAVARTVKEASDWWSRIASSSPSPDLTALDERVLLVLSRNYALPLAGDLARLGASRTQSVMVGGADDIPGLRRIPSDATLRRALGGTLSSINQRMARRLLELSGGPTDWLSSTHMQRWGAWVAEAQVREVFDRRRGDDVAVKAWIMATVAHQGMSATKALREYRDQGHACEQGRFSQLYREVVMKE